MMAEELGSGRGTGGGRPSRRRRRRRSRTSAYNHRIMVWLINRRGFSYGRLILFLHTIHTNLNGGGHNFSSMVQRAINSLEAVFFPHWRPPRRWRFPVGAGIHSSWVNILEPNLPPNLTFSEGLFFAAVGVSRLKRLTMINDNHTDTHTHTHCLWLMAAGFSSRGQNCFRHERARAKRHLNDDHWKPLDFLRPPLFLDGRGTVFLSEWYFTKSAD